ncbi:hypothetical protein FNJ84_08810 [Paracoccus sp. M683]|uniref:hypothetical protein n=1 Tax=Paracoccus sp. M683 TaxID=2594268 RepID=UPI00117FBE2C|nr:hypothetical protein [Paracoccus sp. M683]TRW97594.1 hypothetical protein FNJ84_08810 [Paracoccus sp. M683]
MAFYFPPPWYVLLLYTSIIAVLPALLSLLVIWLVERHAARLGMVQMLVIQALGQAIGFASFMAFLGRDMRDIIKVAPMMPLFTIPVWVGAVWLYSRYGRRLVRA